MLESNHARPIYTVRQNLPDDQSRKGEMPPIRDARPAPLFETFIHIRPHCWPYRSTKFGTIRTSQGLITLIVLVRRQSNLAQSTTRGQWRRQPVGTWARAPLAFENFFSLYVETSFQVWFGTMPNSNSALFVQPYSLWNDTIIGYNGACAKTLTSFLPRDTMRNSAFFAVVRCPSVRLSITFVHCIQTAEDIVKHLSRPGSPIILVFF